MRKVLVTLLVSGVVALAVAVSGASAGLRPPICLPGSGVGHGPDVLCRAPLI
jgi:hypothetical protein